MKSSPDYDRIAMYALAAIFKVIAIIMRNPYINGTVDLFMIILLLLLIYEEIKK